MPPRKRSARCALARMIEEGSLDDTSGIDHHGLCLEPSCSCECHLVPSIQEEPMGQTKTAPTAVEPELDPKVAQQVTETVVKLMGRIQLRAVELFADLQEATLAGKPGAYAELVARGWAECYRFTVTPELADKAFELLNKYGAEELIARREAQRKEGGK